MNIEEIALSKLRKTRFLKRKHSKDQLERCIHSLMTYGQYSPIVVSVNEILCGTLVYDAMKRLKMHRAKVVQLGVLSDEKKKEVRYLDNRTFEMSFWKDDELKQFLMSLDKDALWNCGFNEDETENYINDGHETGMTKKRLIDGIDKQLDTWYCPNCNWEGTLTEQQNKEQKKE